MVNGTKLLLLLCAAALAAGLGTAALLDEKKDDKKKDKEEEKVVETKSGLKYVEQKEGLGDAAKTGDTVSMHYTGTFPDGKKFDSSRGKEPYEVVLGKSPVIQGWHEGIVGMKVGGKRKLYIPSKLAYGPQGRDGIPPDSDLVFELELVKLKDGGK